MFARLGKGIDRMRTADWEPSPTLLGWCTAACYAGVLLVIGLLVGCNAQAAGPGGAARQPAERAAGLSWQYLQRIERASAEYFGLQANPARLAALLHQESAWKPDAQSQFAVGLAQFTPSTAAWLPTVCPELGAFDPWDPTQAIRGSACYQAHLHRQIAAATPCDRWAMVLAAYNGGIGWLRRDQRLARAAGADPERWWGHVELHTRRAEWARKENRSYPRRILLGLEPAYLAAGWPGSRTCTPTQTQ